MLAVDGDEWRSRPCSPNDYDSLTVCCLSEAGARVEDQGATYPGRGADPSSKSGDNH